MKVVTGHMQIKSIRTDESCIKIPILALKVEEIKINAIKLANILYTRYLQEFQPLGTAGGIYHFRDQIAMGEPEAFLVLNADIMGDYPLLEFVEFHRKHPGEHSILATEVRTVAILLLNI